MNILGTNIEDGQAWPPIPPFFNNVSTAVRMGLLKEEIVRERAKPLFEVRMRLGEFDPPSMNPYSKLNDSMVQSPEHRDLSLQLAMMSFVLLKNKDSFLPLSKKYNKLAVSKSTDRLQFKMMLV